MVTRVQRLLEAMDRQCRLAPDGRTTIPVLAAALYGGTGYHDRRAVTQLLYRARLAGHRFDYPRTGTRAGRLRRLESD